MGLHTVHYLDEQDTYFCYVSSVFLYCYGFVFVYLFPNAYSSESNTLAYVRLGVNHD